MAGSNTDMQDGLRQRSYPEVEFSGFAGLMCVWSRGIQLCPKQRLCKAGAEGREH